MTHDQSPLQFSPAEDAALSCVLDAIIPPCAERGLPGAGELGLAAYIAEMVQKSPELAPVLHQGLAVADELASRHGVGGFAELETADRRAVLEELSTREPAFIPSLLFHTFSRYYQYPRVLEALGLEGRPPYPKGFELEESDLDSLLAAVRRRPLRYQDR